MKLHRAIDGHYYLQGSPFPGAGFVTYQVSQQAVDELARFGIKEEDSIPSGIFDRIKNEGLIWFRGDNPPRDLPIINIPLQDFEKLLDILKKWGMSGGIPGDLQGAISFHRSSITIAHCFDENFCGWVIERERELSPASIAELSYLEVHEYFLSRSRIEGSRLHKSLLRDEQGHKVIYYWIKWIAEVYRIRLRDEPCPAEWADTVYSLIYNLLDEYEYSRPTPSEIWRRPAPYVRWSICENLIETVLPEQLSPKEAELRLFKDSIQIPLTNRIHGKKILWLEKSHPITDPENPVTLECHYSNNGRPIGKRSITFPEQEVLLFAQDGTFIDPLKPIYLKPDNGSFYLLARSGLEKEIEKCGISLNPNDSEIEPAGWEDWFGYHITITGNPVQLASYNFILGSPSIDVFIPETNGSFDVKFSHSDPILLGNWPEILVQASQKEIRVYASVGGNETFIVFSDDTPRKILNLNDYPDMIGLYGQVSLNFSCASASGIENVSKRFFRLPGWHFEYIEDPDQRSIKAVKIIGVPEGDTLVPLENCRVVKEKASIYVISALDPLRSSLVGVSWGRADGETVPFTLRLPVTRVTIVNKGELVPLWSYLPLKVDENSFASSPGEIRLELMDELLGAKTKACMVKPAIGNPCELGRVSGHLIRIPIHRLRDFFGIRIPRFFVQTKKRWECFLQIEVASRKPELAPELGLKDRALWNDDRAEVWKIWEKCKRGLAGNPESDQWTNLLLGPHLGDWSGVDDLLDTIELTEAPFMISRCLIRRGLDYNSIEQLREQIGSWGRSHYADFAYAELWYRQSRMNKGEGCGALESCYKVLASLPALDPITDLESCCLSSIAAILLSGSMEFSIRQINDVLISKSRLVQFLANVHSYVNTAFSRSHHEDMPNCPSCFDVLLDPDDILVLRTCSAQIQHDYSAARRLLNELRNRYNKYPFVFDLLNARQCRCEGKMDDAESHYRIILDRRKDFILDEMYSGD